MSKRFTGLFRLCQGVFDIPALIQTAEYVHRIQVKSNSPIASAQCFVIDGVKPCPASVSALLSGRRPMAVIRRIGTIVVASVDRVAARTWSHVTQKSREIIAPFIADGDTSRAIARKFWTIRIQAALLEAFPDSIFARVCASRLPMRGASSDNDLAVETAATLRYSGSQIVANDFDLCAAIAATDPEGFASASAIMCGASKHDPSPESATGQVNQATHHFFSMWVSMMRRTSSATEIPSRFASFLKKAICGSVNEIICLVIPSVFVVVDVSGLTAEFSEQLFGIRFGSPLSAHAAVFTHNAYAFACKAYGSCEMPQGPILLDQLHGQIAGREGVLGRAEVVRGKTEGCRHVARGNPCSGSNGGLGTMFLRALCGHDPSIPQGIHMVAV